jgi:hypothetical protein
MPSRTRVPEEVRIELPTDGDWILVKKYLTWGEARDSEVRLFKAGVKPGELRVDPAQIGATLVVAYLLDWSLTDADGNPILVRRKGEEAILAALRALDQDKGNEIIAAVTKHDAAMTAAIEAEKKDPAGATASSAISASVA